MNHRPIVSTKAAGVPKKFHTPAAPVLRTGRCRGGGSSLECLSILFFQDETKSKTQFKLNKSMTCMIFY